MQREHGLWDVKGKPDVTSVACMRHCDPQAALHSSLPEAARNAHGNLALQQRDYGPTRGIASGAPAAAASALSLAQSNACLGCHAVNDKLVGPAFTAVAARYKERSDAAALLSAKIRQGGFGNWGELPMPAQTQLRDADLNTIVQWLLAGAKP
jgi:cytochrome c